MEMFFVERKSRPKNFLEQIVPKFSSVEFLEHFRVSRLVAEAIAGRFRDSPLYNHQCGPNGKLEPYAQTLIYLWFVGRQTTPFRAVADRFNIALSTLHRIIGVFTTLLSSLSSTAIKWPTQEEKIISENYFRCNGFPGAIEAIDSTHIKIKKPNNNPDSYLNKEYFHSIQVRYF